MMKPAMLLSAVILSACAGSPGEPPPVVTGTVSGVVSAAFVGGVVAGASVRVGTISTTTGADGQFELLNVPVGPQTIIASAADFESRSQSVTLTEGNNTHDILLLPADKGVWG